MKLIREKVTPAVGDRMGEGRMKCPECGNENVNEMLVEFTWVDPEQGEISDITTMPKFLVYLLNPDDRRMTSAEPKEAEIGRVLKISCNAHAPFGGPSKLEIHKTKGRVEIKPTRWGI